VSDWIEGDNTLLRPMVDEAARKYARKRTHPRLLEGMKRREGVKSERVKGDYCSSGFPLTHSHLHPSPIDASQITSRSHEHAEAAGNCTARVNNIEVIYDHVILVLKGVSLEVHGGRIVALLAPMALAKSTTLKSISPVARRAWSVTKGSVEFDGERIDQRNPADWSSAASCR